MREFSAISAGIRREGVLCYTALAFLNKHHLYYFGLGIPTVL